jgi:hypothetical protein
MPTVYEPTDHVPTFEEYITVYEKFAAEVNRAYGLNKKAYDSLAAARERFQRMDDNSKTDAYNIALMNIHVYQMETSDCPY